MAGVRDKEEKKLSSKERCKQQKEEAEERAKYYTICKNTVEKQLHATKIVEVGQKVDLICEFLFKDSLESMLPYVYLYSIRKKEIES